MNWLWILAVVFVVLGSLMAMAEASLTRMTRIRALSLEEEGRRNAALLVKLETDPPRYLNSVYLTVMIVQNGSAILVAILAESTFGGLGVGLASLIFTLLYFVLVEAMSKTFAILHSDRVALALAPLVFFLGRLLAWPTRALIGLANVLLPGKGLKAGPFVSEGDIRSMAEVGSEEGSIEEEEKELIHSIFEFGDTIVREVMVPRPDIICIEDDQTLRDVQALVLSHGTSRIPVYNAEEDLDDVIGIIFAKDVLKALHQGKQDLPLAELVRPARYVPESKKVGVLLREMQQEKFHMALVTDEYDREEREIERVKEGVYRVSGKASVDDVNEELESELPDEEWDTIAGLVLDLFGRIPDEGEEVTFEGLRFVAEEVIGRRIAKVLITRMPPPGDDPVPVEVGEADA